LIVGSFQSGPIVALILKLMYESGWSSNSIFQLLNYLSVLVWVRTILLMPYTHVPQDTDCEYICLLEKLYRKVCSKKLDTSSEMPAESNELYTSEKLLSITSEKEKNEINDNSQIESETSNTSPTFIDILKTKLFWFEVFFFVCLHIRCEFFFSSYVTWFDLTFATENPGLLSTMLDWLGIIQAGIVLTSPLNGLFIDLLTKTFKSSLQDEELALRKATFVSLGVTSIICTVFSILMCIPSLGLQYVAYVVLLLYRSFVYGGMFAYITSIFPKNLYGHLVGFVMFFAGVLQLVQYPLLEVSLDTFDGNFLPVNVAFIVVCFCTILHPVYHLFVISKGTQET